MELILIAVMAFALMMWMSSRSRKQQRAALSFRDSLEPGQEVMTGSGYFGRIVAVEGDRITLESVGGSRSEWLRAAIAKLADPVVLDDAETGELETPVVTDVEESGLVVTEDGEIPPADEDNPYGEGKNS